MEGKALAIDSSIWIYQFQATMRDKEGRALVNAHVLGFLRRICKLLFYGIKPVFVFDGGAPALKRNTIVRLLNKAWARYGRCLINHPFGHSCTVG
jgi:DNA excision repair protein ERCC-5